MTTLGSSIDINQARCVVDSIRSDIDLFNCSYNKSTIEIDWGLNKSQGKRIGSICKGAMSSNLKGVKKYSALDLGVYTNDYALT